MEIMPAASISGEIVLPGDKSISHRAAILASIAEGVTRVHNFSGSADCHATLECLRRLGVEISQTAADVIVTGVGKSGFSPPAAALDCGNSGTTMRLLCGLLAGQDFESVLTGDESLQKRPMGRVIAPLGEMGAVIESCGGFAPLTIHGRSPLRAASITPEFASAQVKSAILLAGLNSNGNTSVIETTQTRDHTERMLRWLGAAVDVEIIDGGMRLTVSGDATLAGRDITVPSDISAATFFAIAAACLPDSEILMKGVGVNASRRAILDVLIRFGANI
ncbi:MAG TPA: 3-phosphoshikimate 1-carboxyvinyltransferase, partial [Pyrinomonadaceae bacterium]|nr:3-phosphoshikimate 1-carboxyvinyltransferase [Pyrinomonadaceae bacterium]